MEMEVSRIAASLRKRVLGISADETSFARRGFRGGAGGMRERLELIGRTFVDGYHTALFDPQPERLGKALGAIPLEFRGFAYEGAAMALALLDWLTPWKRNRLRAFLQGSARVHTYMVHVALGWVMARVPISVTRTRARLDPLLGWLALDGYGFHEGFFHWPRYVHGEPVPRRLKGYERRVFDQGLGRSFWFVDGGDASLIAETIRAFPAERQSDLWSGLGLSCAYAGVADDPALRRLHEAAGTFRAHLAQGAAFAAKARQRAGNLIPHTQRASEIFCGLSAEDAAQLTDDALENLPMNGAEPAYETWRCRIQAAFTEQSKPVVNLAKGFPGAL